MTAEDKIKLTIAGKVAFSDDISMAQAVEILAYLSSGTAATVTKAGPGGGTASGIGTGSRRQGGMSPKQALDASGAKTNPEKIVAFAVLVATQSDKDTFTVEDVKPLFRQAREAAPSNFTRDLDAAIRRGWVSPAETTGEYYVMHDALGVLDDGFDSIRTPAAGLGRTRNGGAGGRRPRKQIATPDVFANAEISPVIDGVINYHKVKTKTDKYLWAVYAAKKFGAEALTTGDLVWLTDKLGEVINRSDLNGYFRANFKAGYVNKNAQGSVRITPDGIEYVQSLTVETVK